MRSPIPPFARDLIDRYEREGFWYPEVLAATLRRVAAESPDRELVVDPRGRLTYGRAAELVDRAARGLFSLGVRPGDCVVVQLPNWHECVVMHFALEALGAVSVPLPPIYRAKEVGYILGLTDAKVAVVTPTFRGFDYLEMLEALRPSAPCLTHVVTVGATAGAPTTLAGAEVVPFEVLVGRCADACPVLDVHPDPNALEEIAFTSGSTGDPKGVMHTSNTLTTEHEAGIRGCGVTKDDVIFMASTIGHQLGLSVGIRTPVILGTKVVFVDQWEPERAVEIMVREGVTYTVSTPTFLVDVLRTEALVRHGGLPAVRVWMLAGAVVPEALHDEVRAKMPHLQIAHVFGMTEVGGMVIKPPDAPRSKALATGIPQRGMEVRVFDADGVEVPTGTDGELAVRSPSLFLGYFKQPELSTVCRTPDGFFLTGDQVRRDEDGWIWVTGRIKDLIKRGGENISPAEIEEVLFKHPKVADVAVVGIPDLRLGERVCAFVVVRPNETISLDEIIASMRDSGAAKQKWPERLELIAALPRTSIGKVHKAALRALLASTDKV
jgi:glutaryl-CoA dehydrogenase/cyclohexanecarboxylate-CoA ligase